MVDILSTIFLVLLVTLWILLLRYNTYLHKEDDEDVY